MSTAETLSDKSRFPTFLRTIPDAVSEGIAIAEIIMHFGWTRVGVVVGPDAYSITRMYHS